MILCAKKDRMTDTITIHAIIVLLLLFCGCGLSFWKRLAPREVVLFLSAIATSLVGVMPAKVIFHCIASLAVLILLLQQVIARAFFPCGKWNNLVLALFFGAWLDHERLLLAFRSRFLQASFLIIFAGMATWIGSPINLAVCELAHYNVNALDLLKIAVPTLAAACLMFWFFNVKKASFPKKEKGDAIVPLDSVFVRKGKKEGELIHHSKEISDLLPLHKHPFSFWQSLRWRPFLLLISGLVFAHAIMESGLSDWFRRENIDLISSYPSLFKIVVFIIVFTLSHFLPNIFIAPVALSFVPMFPVLIIAAATSATLTTRSNGTHILASGLGHYGKWDFIKIGTPLSLVCILMEILWN